MEKSCFFWSSYWGKLSEEVSQGQTFEVLGFENLSDDNLNKHKEIFDRSGTLWGFVSTGKLKVNARNTQWEINTGQWFCILLDKNDALVLDEGTKVFGVFSSEHCGLLSMGGPVEPQGRLRYIDGCTDTLLYSPPIIGDPCLNLLHFPKSVDQTSHYHPSSRSGIVYTGAGECISHNATKLEEGLIFYIPAGVQHKFKTNEETLSVISFHPDSDWGPTHETHPMINRTWGLSSEEK